PLAPASVSTPAPAPTPPSARPRSELATLFAKKKNRSAGAEPKEWSGGIAIHPSILAGLAMMAGAAIWFFAGLAAGRIYFYPPIPFLHRHRRDHQRLPRHGVNALGAGGPGWDFPLHCACGRAVFASEGMAGSRVLCACGLSLDVPPLDEIRRRQLGPGGEPP